MVENKANAADKPQKKKSKLKKTFKWLVSAIVLLVVLILAGAYWAWNYFDWKSKVRQMVHIYGSQVVGTDVNIGRIDISLKDGRGSVSDITVGNPKGYSKDLIINLGTVAVKVDTDSVMKALKETAQKTGPKVKTIIIDEVRVNKPEVTYELMNLNKNNANDILANIKQNTASSAQKSEPKPQDENAVQYNVAVKKVVVENGTATVAAGLLGVSKSLSVPLPTITINNLGTEKQGISIENGLARLFQEILKNTVGAVAKVDLSDLLSGVGDLANGAVDAAKGVAGAAADTAGKAAGAATDAAGAAVNGVTDGVKGIANGVGGLFK
ncbi:MAG: hypothetical protein IJ770_01170 [Alphaproteobacteria bacterium]|nr:hypothetical protein [Alphaproteobacteria bacterium]